jgi:hypothetical protein
VASAVDKDDTGVSPGMNSKLDSDCSMAAGGRRGRRGGVGERGSEGRLEEEGKKRTD